MATYGNEQRAPRMVDVARLADVSQQTVSRVVNNHANVAPEIRERVNEAIRTLRYRRNTTARALATSRTMNIGIVSFALSVYGPSVALFGLSDAARRHGYTTSLITLEDVDTANVTSALGHLAADSVDGVIMLAPMNSAVEALRNVTSDLPLVIFEQGTLSSPSAVAIDEVLGSQLATRHLLDLGHQTVHHVAGPRGWMATDARIRGWERELQIANRSVHPIQYSTDWSPNSGYEAGKTLAVDPKVTAVLVANDSMAIGLMKAFEEANLRIPQDVSVVGFDDIAESNFTMPSLTTVQLDFARLGRIAFERLLQLMNGEDLPPAPFISPRLIVRDSTAAVSGRGVTL